VKGKATVTFRRSASGDVTGEIINEQGEIVVSRNFGIMTEEEYRRVLKMIEEKYPDIGSDDPIELTGN